MKELDIGVDLDGVCYNFDEALKLWMVREHDYHPDSLITGSSSWSLAPQWGITEEQFDAYCDQAVDEGYLFRHGKPYPGSQRVLTELTAMGHRIHFVTSRSFGLKSAHNTMDWLHEHEFPYESIHFVHDKTMVNVDVLIDDYERNWRECTDAGIPVLLMDRPWNQHLTEAHRVTWDTLIEKIGRI